MIQPKTKTATTKNARTFFFCVQTYAKNNDAVRAIERYSRNAKFGNEKRIPLCVPVVSDKATRSIGRYVFQCKTDIPAEHSCLPVDDITR